MSPSGQIELESTVTWLLAWMWTDKALWLRNFSFGDPNQADLYTAKFHGQSTPRLDPADRWAIILVGITTWTLQVWTLDCQDPCVDCCKLLPCSPSVWLPVVGLRNFLCNPMVWDQSRGPCKVSHNSREAIWVPLAPILFFPQKPEVQGRVLWMVLCWGRANVVNV